MNNLFKLLCLVLLFPFSTQSQSYQLSHDSKSGFGNRIWEMSLDMQVHVQKTNDSLLLTCNLDTLIAMKNDMIQKDSGTTEYKVSYLVQNGQYQNLSEGPFSETVSLLLRSLDMFLAVYDQSTISKEGRIVKKDGMDVIERVIYKEEEGALTYSLFMEKLLQNPPINDCLDTLIEGRRTLLCENADGLIVINGYDELSGGAKYDDQGIIHNLNLDYYNSPISFDFSDPSIHFYAKQTLRATRMKKPN